ncbi:retrotransposon protein, putative, ty1-copia subclass [Tanacetum coccineum]
MHNMGKTIGELHALLVEYEKGLPKKIATPQVMAIQGGRIQKYNKKSLNAKGKVMTDKGSKDIRESNAARVNLEPLREQTQSSRAAIAGVQQSKATRVSSHGVDNPYYAGIWEGESIRVSTMAGRFVKNPNNAYISAGTNPNVVSFAIGLGESIHKNMSDGMKEVPMVSTLEPDSIGHAVSVLENPSFESEHTSSSPFEGNNKSMNGDSELTKEKRNEIVDTIWSIWKILVAEIPTVTNANSMPSKVPSSDPIVQYVFIHDKPPSYVGAAAGSKSEPSKCKANFRSLFSKDICEGAKFSIPRKVVETVSTRFDNTLYGYFIGKGIAFPVVEYYARLDDGLENGPWMIRNSPIIMKKWSMDTRLCMKELTRIPAWVKIHDVPIQVFSEDRLSIIASQTGKSIMLNSNTSLICIESWGRSSFARCLIEIDAEDILKESLTMGVPLIEASPPIGTTSNVVTLTVVKTNDGLQMVRNKKKRKGKSKSTNGGQLAGPTTIGTSKKDNIITSNSYSALNAEEQDEDEYVENEKAMERINQFISLSLKTLNLLLKSTRQRIAPATTTRRWVMKEELSYLPCRVDEEKETSWHCQGLRGERKLKQGALYLYVGNGIHAQVEAIESYDLILLNGLHCHLAHISKKRIEKLQHDGLLKSTVDESFHQCVSCLSGKMTRKPFPHRTERATDLLGLKHTDVCGPLRHMSRQGARYFITFTDDYSRYGYVYLLKHKHEVFKTFKVFKNEVENQLRKNIKALRSDQGGKYISQEFKDYPKACEIVQQLTPPYTPQHNGMSERRNHTLLGMGYEALVKQDTLEKLQQRYVKCIFVGYLKETMCYYFYFPPENKIVVARYDEFLEKNLISQEVSGRAVELEEIQDEDTSSSGNTNEIHVEVEVEEHSLGDLNETTNYKAAILDPESNKWLDAMNAEMQSMKDNQVWCLVNLSPNGKTVGSKWLFKKKD